MATGKRTQFPAWVVILVLAASIITTFSVLLIMGTLNLVPERPYAPEEPFILYVLTAFNLVAFSIFSFILARLVLRLWRERRARQLGSHLKSRLVRYFIVITILPLVALGLFSYLFINVTIDKWFGQHHETVLRDSRELYERYQTDELLDFQRLTEVLRALIEPAESPDGSQIPADVITNRKLELLQIVERSNEIVFSYRKPDFNLAGDIESALAAARNRLSRGEALMQRLPGPNPEGFRLVAGVPFESRTGGLLAVYRSLPELAERAASIARQHEIYQSQHRRQGKIQRTTFQVLGLITFLLLFAATWAAIHLAKGITTPIQALAEATQKVAQGDFHQAVDCLAEDELAMLVDSFNRMTAQLHESRERLEATAERLRQTNLTLEERRRYIETVLESLSTGIISIDSEDRITTINRAALRILQLQDVQPGASWLTESLTPVLNHKNIRIVARLTQKAKRLGFAAEDLEIEHRAGASHLVMSASALRDEQAHLQGLVIMFEDITELVRAQQHAVWSEVARRMAHEIKNPLTPIQLSAERIQKNLERHEDSLNDHRYRHVITECTSTILSEVQTLQRMVNEFTRFARLPQPRLEDASLNRIVEATIKLYEDRLNGVTIESSLADGLPLVRLDREQIKRALVNLIDNAIEAVQQVDGERRILIETRSLPQRESVQLVVSDTGIGIDAKDYPQLFTPYFSQRAHGTGLGLAIVNHIVAEHHGRVRAEPVRPRGMRFILEFPISQGMEARAAG